MSAAMKTIKKLQDDYLAMMARLEEPVVRFTGRAAESVAEYVPERPHWAFLESVPTMTELVENQLRFRRRVVDQQARFVRKTMTAMEPVLTRLEAKAPATGRAAAKPSPVRRMGVRTAA
jgi:hypothetical protein